MRKVIVVATALATATCCKRVDIDEAKLEFAGKNPACVVEDAFVGEGDSDTAYVTVRFRCPQDPNQHEVEWAYRNTAGGWVPTNTRHEPIPCCSKK